MRNLIYKKVDPADSVLMEKIHRLRYDVYVRECGFIQSECCPGRLEIDEYDDQAIHFAAIKPNEEVLGTVRLILPGQKILPLGMHCPHLIPDDAQHRPAAEISRLIIAKRLRDGKNVTKQCGFRANNRRRLPIEDESSQCIARCITIGLCALLFEESTQRGISRWYALMERPLWMLLRLYGFPFRCLGQAVDVFGPVHPYMADLSTIEQSIFNFSLRYNCPLLINKIPSPDNFALHDPWGTRYQPASR